MNSKIIYASAGGIASIALVIYLITIVNPPRGNDSNENAQQQQGANQTSLGDGKAIEISVKNISAEPLNNGSIDFRVAFNIHNPNKATLILEAISYNLFGDEKPILFGDIGEKLEGFVASQESVFPIIGNGTITLKDSRAVPRNNLPLGTINKILEGNANYILNGTYSYKQTSGLQTSGADKDFELRFP